MIDLERQKENFKNHIAKLTDYGNIKILDFKEPDTSNYRIRFIFEEDYCRLHISGDLGELQATNYNNMTYEGFKDYVDNIGYFEEKIDCHSRSIYTYDEAKAKEDLMKYIEEYDYKEEIENERIYDEPDDAIEYFISDALEDFDEDRGIQSKGYDVISKIDPDFFETVGDIGKEPTGILDLYMMAFKLATDQLKNKEAQHG